MNMGEMETAIRAAGLGWDPWGALVVASLALAERCNVANCKAHTATANEAGLSTSDYMPVVIANAGDPTQNPPVPADRSPLDTATAYGAEIRTALAALGVYRAVEAIDPVTGDTVHGAMTVWGANVAQRAVTYLGALVTTQDYRSQSEVYGASIDDMAQALADLVGGDSTAFDAIMSA